MAKRRKTVQNVDTEDRKGKLEDQSSKAADKEARKQDREDARLNPVKRVRKSRSKKNHGSENVLNLLKNKALTVDQGKAASSDPSAQPIARAPSVVPPVLADRPSRPDLVAQPSVIPLGGNNTHCFTHCFPGVLHAFETVHNKWVK